MNEGLVAVRSAQLRARPGMAIALASLLLGMWAGLARIGWQLPGVDGALMLRHGGLMVVGFVATVISIERAVAVRSAVAFAAPVLSAACGLALIFALAPAIAPLLAALAGAAYTLNMLVLLRRHGTLPLAAMCLGGLCLAASGVVWWHAGAVSTVVPWWVAFLTLTIAAERLELLRFQRISTAGLAHGALASLLLLLGPVVSLMQPETGAQLLGVGLAAGYAWLAVSGVLLALGGLSTGGLLRDATIHAFFIGFVFSAIMAHEPIIAPSVTGLGFAYTPLLYAPLVLLEGALVARVGADLALLAEVRRWSGLVQVTAILLFLALSAGSVLRARHQGSSIT